jgi:predicted flap endonuclease-1-like 5' DNA nuclease
MAWLNDTSQLKTARERAETAFYAPIGMMSPLWIAYSAAASAGAAFWWISRYAQPLNIEAVMASPVSRTIVDTAASELEHDTAAGGAEAASSMMGSMIEPVGEALAQVELATADGLANLIKVESAITDDLTKLAGVGPKIAKAFAERGVESFEQLAAWTEQDIASFDAALDLRGRAVRADFITQARRLAAGEA